VTSPPSIRRHLLRGIFGALLASGAVVFGLLFAIGSSERRAAFEQALQDDLRTIANITQVFPDDDTYVNIEPESQIEYLSGGDRFFQVWDANTHELLDRSESLVALGVELPHPATIAAKPQRFDAALPDGRTVSFVTLRTDANWGIDAATLKRIGQTIQDQPVELLVGRSRGELTASMRPLALACGGGALLLPLLAVLVLSRLVPHALAPLAALGDELSSRSSDDLHPLPASPREELAPVVQKLNELMARIAAARQRERAFLANASHELRTPLAEMRALIDVAELDAAQAAASVEADTDADADAGTSPATHSLADLRDVTRRMSELVDAFLRLARERRATDGPLEMLPLGLTLRHAIEGQQAASHQRGLQWRVDGPDLVGLPAHATLLRALLDNLVANAIAHAGAGGTIRATLFDAPRPGLAIANDCIDEAGGTGAADAAPAHLGHGLVVARLYAQALDASLETERSGATFAATLSFTGSQGK
jgi:signal transduction histidine kinase